MPKNAIKHIVAISMVFMLAVSALPAGALWIDDEGAGAETVYAARRNSRSHSYSRQRPRKSSDSSYGSYSSWAKEYINVSDKLGLIPELFEDMPLDEPVTRLEFCYISMQLYALFSQEYPDMPDGTFADCDDPEVLMAYALGIVDGYGNGEYLPDNPITRQEMFKLLNNLLSSLDIKPDVQDAFVKYVLKSFDDTHQIQSWAVSPSCVMIGADITNGVGDTKLDPNGKTSREQAIVMAFRVYNAIINGDFDNTRNFTYTPGYKGSGSSQSYGKSGDYSQKKAAAKAAYNQKYEQIFGSLSTPVYTSSEEASKHMVSVTVNVWNYNTDGVKVSTTRSVTVHKNIAETVKLIFEEIYNGPEKFPIYSIGGYAWRGGTSEHNWGVAVDINANENMMIKDGVILAGSLWKPGVNKYSIPPDGDVVAAFAKYGFAWGGNAWKSSNDYMHFSFFGE